MGRMVDRKKGGPVPKTGAYNLHEGEYVVSKKDKGHLTGSSFHCDDEASEKVISKMKKG